MVLGVPIFKHFRVVQTFAIYTVQPQARNYLDKFLVVAVLGLKIPL